MPVWFVTGKLGSGKTLVAVSRIQEYLQQGRPVATNLDLNLQVMLKPSNKTSRVIRLPDKPSSADMDFIGRAYTGEYNEDKFGLIVLDELGTWLNSRTWSDKTRKALIDWLIHARKLHWDIIMIVQNIEMVDVQVRNALCEYLVVCRRTDRVKVLGVKPPKVHVGRVFYGSSENPKLLEDRWFYRGTGLYKAYETTQVFSNDYQHGAHSLLPPAYLEQPEVRSTQYKKVHMIKLFLLLCVVGIGANWYFGRDGEASVFVQEDVAVIPSNIQQQLPSTLSEQVGSIQYTGMALIGDRAIYYFESKKFGVLTDQDIRAYGGKVGRGLGCSQNIKWNDESTTIATCYELKTEKKQGMSIF